MKYTYTYSQLLANQVNHRLDRHQQNECTELDFMLLIERLFRHIFHSNIFVMSKNDLRVE
jgi:hypothetical protein